MEMDMPIPKGRGFTPFPFGQCQVCGAEATGNHYGANTCEGCKGFFKRSLPVFRTFRCFFGNKCDVTPETRNRCKACRFRKCVEAGMALDAVKMGRIPKAVKEHAMEAKAPSSHRSNVNRQVSAASQATSRHSGTSSGSTPASPMSHGAASPQSSSGNFSHYGLEDTAATSPMARSRAASSSAAATGGGQAEFRGGLLDTGRRYTMNSPSVSGSHSWMAKSIPEAYRFHPYARPERGFKDERSPTAFSYAAYPTDRLLNGGSSGLLYRGDDGNRVTTSPVVVDRSGWPPTSGQMPVIDYSTAPARRIHSGKLAFTTSDSPAPIVSYSAGVSGGAVSFASDLKMTRGGGFSSHHHPDVAPPTARARAMVDMAITGDFNENEPDLVETSGDQVRAAMANRETAVAVMDPSLRGITHHSMPVVPGDIFVFQPSYVPVDKLPEMSSHMPELTAKSKLNTKKRRFELAMPEDGSRVTYKIPAVPTLEYFLQVSRDPMLKNSVCENTFRTVALQNNAIYGDETRANEEFLKKAVGTGAPTAVEHTGQEMRDILKDRLITQVKRVVQLSESIPGFRTLNVKDQHALLRTCILDVWMVHSARFLRDEQSYILFLETRTHYSRHWMEQFLTDEFLNTVFQIATRINSLDLSFDELALLKSILIVRPDRPGLENVEFITALHNHLLDSLKLAIAARRPVESIQLLDDFLELLKGWSILDLMQEKYVHPIDLSQMCQGPWKIGETPGSASSKNSDAGVSPTPKQQLSEANFSQRPVSLQA